MPEDKSQDASRAQVPWLSLIVALTFIGLVIAYLAFAPGTEDAAPLISPETKNLVDGELYYLFVESVEFEAEQAEGESWDLDNSAPDMAYAVSWRGKTIFESSTVSDALIGRWSGIKIGLDQAISLVQQGKSDPSQIIDAALVRAEPKGSIIIRFYDSDVAEDDIAATFVIALEQLHLGANSLKSSSQGQGIRHASLRVVKSEADLFQVLRALSERGP